MKSRLSILLAFLFLVQLIYSKNKNENIKAPDIAEKVFSTPTNKDDLISTTRTVNTSQPESKNNEVGSNNNYKINEEDKDEEYINNEVNVDKDNPGFSNTVRLPSTQHTTTPSFSEREKYGINTSDCYRGWEKDLELAKRQEKIDIIVKVVWGIVITIFVIVSGIFIKNLLISKD
ncbi:MAG: hypothetical protein U0T69_09230 [Chitinophagales bacterium]